MLNKHEWMWDFLTDRGIATNEEIGLVIALMGATEQTFKAILHIRTGYNSFEQMLEEEEELDEE